MARSHRSERNKRQQNNDDAQSFSAAFAQVPVPNDILQRRAVNQDEVEAEIEAQDNEGRSQRNAIGDAVGHAGDPLFVVCRNNRRNLDNLSEAGR
jgi:hypothetical protein